MIVFSFSVSSHWISICCHITHNGYLNLTKRMKDKKGGEGMQRGDKETAIVSMQ